MWKHALLVSCLASLFFDCIAGQSEKSCAASPCAENSMNNVDKRIVNGVKAVLGEFPQQVSLRRGLSQSHYCGGSVLAPDWVLTAAHCLVYSSGKMIDATSILVIAGDVHLKNTDKAYRWSYGKKQIVHPEFNLSLLQNDIALLQLKTPFVFDPYVQAIPVTRKSMAAGTDCRVCGWGHTKEGGKRSSELMYVHVPLISTSECMVLMQSYCLILPGTICAGYMKGGKDACQGDSGGGLICGKYLTGVVSSGTGCARPKHPGLYADVAYYVTWVENYVDLKRKYPVRSTLLLQSSAMPRLPSSFVILICEIAVLINLYSCDSHLIK